jgi:hypothetical protein
MKLEAADHVKADTAAGHARLGRMMGQLINEMRHH